jgi:hypothetical protein
MSECSIAASYSTSITSEEREKSRGKHKDIQTFRTVSQARKHRKVKIISAYFDLFNMTKAPITPGTQPNSVRINMIVIEPHPWS